MKHLLSILLTAILCATSTAQTIRTLGYNTTNGQVVANTGTNVLTFTNDVKFGNGDLSVSGLVISGPQASLSFEDGAYTGTLYMDNGNIEFSGTNNAAATRANLGFSTNLNTLWTATNAATARTNLSLGLPALTNTSTVTMMRALAGSTNTNEPYSGVIEYHNHNADPWFMDVSNGIILRIYE